MDSKERREKIKKQLDKLGIKKRKNSVKLTCINCGNTDEIHTNNPVIYTEEIRKTYQCWKCKPAKDKKEVIKEKKKQIDQKELVIEKKQEEVIVKEEVKAIRLRIREDGVLRISKRLIENYGFTGGDSLKIDISIGKIVITKEVANG